MNETRSSLVPRRRPIAAQRFLRIVLLAVSATAWGLAGPAAGAPPALVISTVDSMGATGIVPSLAIGQDGRPIMSYLDGEESAIKVAHCNASDCNSTDGYTETVIDSIFETISSIAIGTDGLPIVSYGVPPALKVAHCNAANCNAVDGLTSSVVDTGRVSATALAIGSDGLPVVAYVDFDTDELRVAHCNAVDCNTVDGASIATLDSGDLENRVSLAIGSDGLPLVVYSDHGSDVLKAAHCNAVDCNSAAGSTLTVIDTAIGEDGGVPSLAIGLDGLPIVSYLSAPVPGQQSLKVAHCGAVSCSAAGGHALTEVDAGSDLGQLPSLAIGADGQPVISYTKGGSPFDLTVARCRAVDCNVGAGFSRGVVDTGIYSSPAIGVDGLPVIAYFGTPTADLKVARCANAGCRTPLFDDDFETGDTSRWQLTVP